MDWAFEMLATLPNEAMLANEDEDRGLLLMLKAAAAAIMLPRSNTKDSRRKGAATLEENQADGHSAAGPTGRPDRSDGPCISPTDTGSVGSEARKMNCLDRSVEPVGPTGRPDRSDKCKWLRLIAISEAVFYSPLWKGRTGRPDRSGHFREDCGFSTCSYFAGFSIYKFAITC